MFPWIRKAFCLCLIFAASPGLADHPLTFEKAVVGPDGSVFGLFTDSESSFIGRFEKLGSEWVLVELTRLKPSTGRKFQEALKVADIAPYRGGVVALAAQVAAPDKEFEEKNDLFAEKLMQGRFEEVLEEATDLRISQEIALFHISEGKIKKKRIDVTYRLGDQNVLLHAGHNGRVAFVYEKNDRLQLGWIDSKGKFDPSFFPIGEDSELMMPVTVNDSLRGEVTNLIELPKNRETQDRPLQVGFQTFWTSTSHFWRGGVVSSIDPSEVDFNPVFQVQPDFRRSEESYRSATPRILLGHSGHDIYVVRNGIGGGVGISKHSLLPESVPQPEVHFDWLARSGRQGANDALQHTLQVLPRNKLLIQGRDSNNDIHIHQSDADLNTTPFARIADVAQISCDELMKRVQKR